MADISGNETDVDETKMGEIEAEYFSASPPNTPLPEIAGILPAPYMSEKGLQDYMVAINKEGADELTLRLRLAIECTENMLTQQCHVELYCGASRNIQWDIYAEVQAQATRMVKLGSMLKGMLEARIREMERQVNRRASVYMAT